MNFADVIEAWDQADPRYLHPTRRYESEADYWASGLRLAELIDYHVPPQVPEDPPPKILDFGCGDGRVAIPLHHLLAQEDVEMVAADASPTMLTRLHDRCPTVPVIRSDGSNLPSEKYDLIACLAVLIHHSYEDAAMLLSQLRRAARRRATLIASVPTSDSPHERTHWRDVTRWSPEHRQRVTKAAGWEFVTETELATVYRRV